MNNSRLVYSTGDGDRRRSRDEPPGLELPNDGVVRIFREKGRTRRESGHRRPGPAPRRDLAAVAKDLKKYSSAPGGTVKDGAVEIQGDHREKIAARLETQGYTVKLAGGEPSVRTGIM